MDAATYAARLHRDLYAAGAVGGEETLAVAERMAHALDPSIRLILLDALVEATGEITEQLNPGSVEVRLLGREIQFAVTPPPPSVPAPETAAQPAAAADTGETEDEGATARLSLRLPERLKGRVEQAAAAEGLSVNAWLVRSIGSLVEPQSSPPRTGVPTAPIPPTPTFTMGQRHTGWAR